MIYIYYKDKTLVYLECYAKIFVVWKVIIRIFSIILIIC
jgi:hypothetical protein